ncbi:MAG: DUF4321 domain-containing protein [Fibrobacterota bacterium]
MNNGKSFWSLFFFLLFGLILGSMVGKFVGSFLPEGAPKKALFNTITVGFGFGEKNRNRSDTVFEKNLDEFKKKISETAENLVPDSSSGDKEIVFPDFSEHIRDIERSYYKDLSSDKGSDSFILDLYVVKLKLGMQLTLNIVSILGAWVAVYYFRWFY